MKNAWIRLVFVLCTLSALLYVAVGVGCTLSNEGKAYPFSNESPESAAIFVGVLGFNVGLVIILHVLSFIITGKTEHFSCMLDWLWPPIVVALVCFLAGRSLSQGWETAFAIPCHWTTAIGLPAFTIGFIASRLYPENYAKLTEAE